MFTWPGIGFQHVSTTILKWIYSAIKWWIFHSYVSLPGRVWVVSNPWTGKTCCERTEQTTRPWICNWIMCTRPVPAARVVIRLPDMTRHIESCFGHQMFRIVNKIHHLQQIPMTQSAPGSTVHCGYGKITDVVQFLYWMVQLLQSMWVTSYECWKQSFVLPSGNLT
jgi:hypothetical protein